MMPCLIPVVGESNLWWPVAFGSVSDDRDTEVVESVDQAVETVMLGAVENVSCCVLPADLSPHSRDDLGHRFTVLVFVGQVR